CARAHRNWGCRSRSTSRIASAFCARKRMRLDCGDRSEETCASAFPYIVLTCTFLPSMADPSNTAPAVVLDHVTVSYGTNRALRDVSVVFPTGAVGLLGPNGAGKSTMLKSLLGFIPPSAGRLEVLGRNVAKQPLEVRAA